MEEKEVHHLHKDLILSPDFDITPIHLIYLYNLLDSEHLGKISYNKLLEALESISRTFQNTVKVDLLKKIIVEKWLVDGDRSHDITQSEFIYAIQEYTARALAQSGGFCEMFVLDYGSNVSIFKWIKDSIEKVEAMENENNDTDDEFLIIDPNNQQNEEKSTTLPPNINVRWVAISGYNPSLFIRVCNKYKIHPLQLEDILGKNERPKVELFDDNNIHIILGLVSLKVNNSIYYKVKVRQINILVINQNTVLSFMKKHSDSSSSILYTLNFYHSIKARIMYIGSKLRLGDSKFLTYALVDTVVDQVYPIVKLFTTELKRMQIQIQSKKNTNLETINQIQQIYREGNVLHFWLRAIYTGVVRLSEDFPGNSKELKNHLEDIKDHILMLIEQAASIITWARSLNEDYRNEQAHRMSQVMYVLTLVSTIFIPAQFLTGVFGMNFKFMPELQFKYSYLAFWFFIVTASCTFIIDFDYHYFHRF